MATVSRDDSRFSVSLGFESLGKNSRSKPKLSENLVYCSRIPGLGERADCYPKPVSQNSNNMGAKR